MQFTIEKIEQTYIIKEAGRTIFTSDYHYDDKLLSLYLRNIYGDEALALYEIKKWHSVVRTSIAQDFTIYEGDVKMGELHKIKGGYEFDFQGVRYHFYGGVMGANKKVICFDRNEQCAEMTFNQTLSVRFTNSTLGALMSLFCVLLHEFSLIDRCSQDVFLEKYEEEFVA